ncbi:hypothetical protein LAUMK4_02900 [Mycobacterium persicum]|uniref:Uncharacterized protein n=1 Tax=Mycobacterium persicum TaxID=1487726 RepID=A0ABY6RJ93_9MYCO|nr:hypothetical protein LAUMK15_03226 [Mycobacterium persicum]VAZ94741.1 hypothetical protein LAUMK4_02900 [Mycobacterium persicum]
MRFLEDRCSERVATPPRAVYAVARAVCTIGRSSLASPQEPARLDLLNGSDYSMIQATYDLARMTGDIRLHRSGDYDLNRSEDGCGPMQ